MPAKSVITSVACSASCRKRTTPPGLRIVVATVTGWIPVARIALALKASTPPEKEMGRAPSNSAESVAARESESGRRERPDMYISSAGSSPAMTSTGKVLVSLMPNRSPRLSACAVSRRNIATASEYCRSSRK